MRLQEFIQQINDAIPAELRDEIALQPTFTVSDTLAAVSTYCTALYDVLEEQLPAWLLETFEHEQLLIHNLHLNAVNTAGKYDTSETQHFLYTIPIRAVFDKELRIRQYGDADITVSRGDVSIYNNHSHVLIHTGVHAKLYGQTQATVDGKAIVEAHENSCLTVQGNALVKATGNCYLTVNTDATIDATDCVNIEIQGGSPIIIANKNVRIANCIKPEAKQNVRLMIEGKVLLVCYPDNGDIVPETNHSQSTYVWMVEEYYPILQKFIDNMRARYASGCEAISWSNYLMEDPTIQQSKKALLDLIRTMPQTETKAQLKMGLTAAVTHKELLKVIIPHMDLLVQHGLNQKFLNTHFNYVDLSTAGIYTHADYFHHFKGVQKDIYLFGQEHYPVPSYQNVRVHGYENTVVFGDKIDVDLHDHSLALMHEYGQVQITDQSIAGGTSAKQLTMAGHSYAQISNLGMADLEDDALLVNPHHIDIVSLSDKAQAYTAYPPSRINNHSTKTQLHYTRQDSYPLVTGSLTGITPYDTIEAFKALLKSLSQRTPGQHKGNQRGR